MRNYPDNRIPPAPQRQVKKLKTINERMNDLDDIAQTYAGKICGNDEDSNYNAWFNVYKKKFAELIVQDCLFIIDDERKSEMVSRIDLWNQVKQHFGVEE